MVWRWSIYRKWRKKKISITEINKWSLDKIKSIKEVYDRLVDGIDTTYFEENIAAFVEANKDRYNSITEEAMRFVLSYKDQYAIEDMMVSFSGGKDSTVTSHIVNTALGTNKVLHVFGDTTLEFPTTIEYKKRFNKNDESKGVRILTGKNRWTLQKK